MFTKCTYCFIGFLMLQLLRQEAIKQDVLGKTLSTRISFLEHNSKLHIILSLPSLNILILLIFIQPVCYYYLHLSLLSSWILMCFYYLLQIKKLWICIFNIYLFHSTYIFINVSYSRINLITWQKNDSIIIIINFHEWWTCCLKYRQHGYNIYNILFCRIFYVLEISYS